MATIVLQRRVNESALAWVFRRVRDAADEDEDTYATKGMRVARAHDPHMMLAMEKLASLATTLADLRSGRVRRDTATPFSLRVEPQEAQHLHQAYITADSGRPEPIFGYLYAAVAEWAGVIIR